MKVLITGGTGMIGRRLAKHLIRQEHEVVILSRSPERRVEGLPDSVRLVGWDARTPRGWEDEVNSSQAVVNLAGAPLPGEGFFPKRWTDARRQILWDSRVQAGQAVVDAITAADSRPQVVLQASAIGYYGPNPPGVVTEESPPGDDFLSQLTVAWEESTLGMEELGVRRVVVRTGIVLDPQDGALPRLLLPFRLFVGGPMGSGRQWMSWIHPADEIAALAFLLTHTNASGPFNLTAPNPVSNSEFSNTLGGVLGRPSWFPLPGFALKLAFGEVSTTVLDGQQVLPMRLSKLGFEFRFPTLSQALKDILD
jgi:uncharacterized protein (TIGR01777 family)